MEKEGLLEFEEKKDDENEKHEDTFSKFPPLILVEIGKQLPLRDLVALSGVNKKCNRVINDHNILWKKKEEDLIQVEKKESARKQVSGRGELFEMERQDLISYRLKSLMKHKELGVLYVVREGGNCCEARRECELIYAKKLHKQLIREKDLKVLKKIHAYNTFLEFLSFFSPAFFLPFFLFLGLEGSGVVHPKASLIFLSLWFLVALFILQVAVSTIIHLTKMRWRHYVGLFNEAWRDHRERFLSFTLTTLISLACLLSILLPLKIDGIMNIPWTIVLLPGYVFSWLLPIFSWVIFERNNSNFLLRLLVALLLFLMLFPLCLLSELKLRGILSSWSFAFIPLFFQVPFNLFLYFNGSKYLKLFLFLSALLVPQILLAIFFLTAGIPLFLWLTVASLMGGDIGILFLLMRLFARKMRE